MFRKIAFCAVFSLLFSLTYVVGTTTSITQFPLSTVNENCGFDAFCRSDNHLGSDLKATQGMKVYSPIDGVVREVGPHKGGYAGVVVIEFQVSASGGQETNTLVVGHLNYDGAAYPGLQVSSGQRISTGTLLGYVADQSQINKWNPGHPDQFGPHVHWGIRRGAYVYTDSLCPSDFQYPNSYAYRGYTTCQSVVDNYWLNPMVYMLDRCVGCYNNGWNNDESSQKFLDAYLKQRNYTITLDGPKQDSGNQQGHFVHLWSGTTNLYVQNFENDDLKKRGVIIWKQGQSKTHVIRGGFWQKYRYNDINGPNAYGAPTTDEGVWNDGSRTYQAAQQFENGLMLWDPTYNNGNVEFRRGYQAQGIVAIISPGTVQTAGFTGSDVKTFTLSAQSVSPSQVVLSVNNGNNPIYQTLNLLRDGVVIATYSGVTTTITDNSVASNTTYEYQLNAFSSSGDGTSSSVSEAITLTTPPSPNTLELAADEVLSNYVHLVIQDTRYNALVYGIYRNNVLIARTSGHEFSDIELTPATTYTYRVDALTASNLVLGSTNTLTLTTLQPVDTSPPPPPPPPADPVYPIRLVDGVHLVSPAAPDVVLINSCVTASFTLEDIGTVPVTLDSVIAIADVDMIFQQGQRFFKRDQFDTPMTLQPGQRYTYQQNNCGNVFPGVYSRAVVKPYFKVHTVAGDRLITDKQAGTDYLSFEILEANTNPDLVMQSMTMNPAQPRDGEAVAITFTATNHGDRLAPTARLQVICDIGGEHNSTYTQIDPNGTATLTFDLGMHAAGTYHCSYTIDPSNYIHEWNENNNTGSLYYTIGSSVIDSDSDGIQDNTDNCPTISNTNQLNTDGDAFGDACDSCPTDATNTCLYLAQYFNTVDLTGPVVISRNETAVDHNWDTGSPDPLIDNEIFSARYTRTTSFAAGTYQFNLSSDDGSRLYIDDVPIINDWWDHAIQDYSATKYLTAGNHTLRVEYYERGGGAILHFSYTYLGNDGWESKYWNTPTAGSSPQIPTTAPNLIRLDTAIDFNWGGGSPDPTITNDKFILQATRTRSFTGGTWRFRLNTDDGSRLYIDNQLIIDRWVDQGLTPIETNVTLSAGIHTLRVDYYENGGGAECYFSFWPLFDTTPFSAEYFTNRYLTGTPSLTRNDAGINFDWGGGNPGSPIPNDNFSARWTKTLFFDAGTYQLRVTADDGVRLYVDNQLVIDKWIDQGSTTYTAIKTLSAGNHTIRMEYYENGGGAVAKFYYRALN